MTILGAISSDFAIQLYGTFIGAFLGIPAALWLDRRIKRKQSAEEERNLTDALREALQHNIDLVQQLNREWSANASWVPFYPMDLLTLDSSANAKYDILTSREACAAIDTARYEVLHLDGKLRMIRDIWPHTATSPGAINQMDDVRQSCLNHLPKVLKSLDAAVKLLDADLSRSPAPPIPTSSSPHIKTSVSGSGSR